jgi:hypothetical protein
VNTIQILSRFLAPGRVVLPVVGVFADAVAVGVTSLGPKWGVYRLTDMALFCVITLEDAELDVELDAAFANTDEARALVSFLHAAITEPDKVGTARMARTVAEA